MTLAAILCVSVLCSALSAAVDSRAFPREDAPAASSGQTTNPTPARNLGNAAVQNSTTPANPATTTPATGSNPSAQTAPNATTPHRRRKKKPPQDPCDLAKAAETSAPSRGSTATSAAPADPSTASTPAAPAQSPQLNCPPKKVIVRQGGTSDPSIELGGTAGSGPSHDHDNTTQMLATADINLKKLDGQKLTADQQEVVTQIKQFMGQAKTADVSGDPERARTLAWKAQLLSESLVKPQE
jgi:hypothetical protein